MKRLVCSTTGWGMILCLVAAVSPILPWHVRGGVCASGYGDWHGPTINVIAALGFIFLIATSPLSPVPWWRILGVAAVGAGVVVVVLMYAMRPGSGWMDFPVAEYGGLLAILSAAGLLLVAALEVRQLILKRLADSAQQKPQA
jgi:hypothetical protein